MSASLMIAEIVEVSVWLTFAFTPRACIACSIAIWQAKLLPRPAPHTATILTMMYLLLV